MQIKALFTVVALTGISIFIIAYFYELTSPMNYITNDAIIQDSTTLNVNCSLMDKLNVFRHECNFTINTTTLIPTLPPTWIPTINPTITPTKKNSINCELMRESNLYIKECNFKVSKVYPLLITSTPRSGTVAMVKLLNKIGIPIRDDWGRIAFNQIGAVSWILAFSDKHDNFFGPVKINNARFNTIFHQIRDPLKSITSMCTEPVTNDRYRSYIDRKININVTKYDKTSIELRMIFWLEWHQKLDDFGFEKYKMEDVFSNPNTTKGYNIIYHILNKSNLLKYIKNKQFLNGELPLEFLRKANSRKHRAYLNWNELLTVNYNIGINIYNKAIQYGYTYPSWNVSNFTKLDHIPTC